MGVHELLDLLLLEVDLGHLAMVVSQLLVVIVVVRLRVFLDLVDGRAGFGVRSLACLVALLNFRLLHELRLGGCLRHDRLSCRLQSLDLLRQGGGLDLSRCWRGSLYQLLLRGSSCQLLEVLQLLRTEVELGGRDRRGRHLCLNNGRLHRLNLLQGRSQLRQLRSSLRASHDALDVVLEKLKQLVALLGVRIGFCLALEL